MQPDVATNTIAASTSRSPCRRRPPPCGRDGASGTTRWNKVRSNGQLEDFEIGVQKVSASWRSSGHTSGEVVVEAQLAPRPDEARNQRWTYQGSVEVLVIADLEDTKQ
ncbi:MULTISPECIES: hypothetical protein [Streptomyces]|uniref:Uncharacterized protein n=1 Tax=Streptomyces ehimensis TaxID=68195 RepID=A0ABV9BVX4_9ACTN